MDQVAQIREKIDIVSFISGYIPVKKAGRNFQALCPFHGEKTPSFVISPERQMWHCFGCGKGGDVYTFLMEFEHMEFPEALRFLAKQTGIQLTSEGYADSTASAKKEKLYRVNTLAAEFYHYILTRHNAGKKALDYLAGRGLTDKLINTFKIGYSPSGGRTLVRYLFQKKQYQKEDLVDAGLVTIRSSGISDFFRGRVMFPLIDHRDNVLGFSGRIFDEKIAFGGKYINTRDTLIYHKREHFFGINITKEYIRKANQAILVEGEFDLISCFHHGITNVAAVKGTALTEQQVNLLNRYAHKITICFDGDSAGQEAIKRSLPVIAKKGLNTTVAVITSGKDPDEALKTDPGQFKHAVEHDINVYDYLFDRTVQKYSTSTSEGKQSITDELLPFIGDIENAIIREHYLRKLSVNIDTTYESILQEIEKRTKKVSIQETAALTKIQKPREELLEEYLLALILQSNEIKKFAAGAWKILNGQMSDERAYQKLFYYVVEFTGKTDGIDLTKFGYCIPTELLDAYNTAMLFPLPPFADEEKYADEVIKKAEDLKIIYVKDKIKRLAEQIKLVELQGNENEAEELKGKYTEMVSMLKK